VKEKGTERVMLLFAISVDTADVKDEEEKI